MSEDFTSNGDGGHSSLERATSRPNEGEQTAGPPPRVMTDGGQAEMEESEDEEPEDEAETNAEAEAAVEDEGEAAESEVEVETDEEPEEEGEEEPAEAEEEEEEEEPEEEDEYHVEGADEVYESDDTSGVLHLDLGGLFFDLLGLEVNLDPVTLDVSARPGENNLLGNLLSAVSGLLDGTGGMINKAKSLLSKPVEFVRNVLNKPVEKLTGLFGGGESDEAAEDEDEGETEGEAGSPGPLSSAVTRLKNGVSGAASWLREKLAALVPSFPTEEIVSAIVSAILEQLLEQLEPQRTDETRGETEPSQAEATS
ncbi:hypothetical protein [Natrinema sp. 74]|uniref:hypothetical protein n=1 Tax=Natrinema sp. 74 TaxID=3384159 RepID=UPI0038D3768A